MPSYGSQIPEGDRWAIVAYVRALQLSQRAPAAVLTADERSRLREVAP
jgi:DNA-directed RNA polymerase subunit K/omega